MKNKKSFYTSWGICILFCSIAFALLLLDFVEYGISMFCIFPIILGVATGIIPDRKGAVVGLSIGLITFFLLLLAAGLEGVICLIMATPIISVLIFLGYLISFLIKRSRNKKRTKTYATLIPLLIFIASSGIENFMGNPSIKEKVTSSITVPFSKEEVYDNIIHVDTVSAEIGTLHQLGLPIPYNCKLTEEKIGGLRICEFNEGEIIEQIKDFKRGEYLKMDVVEFNLKGRPWLTFDEDIYTMEETKEGTKISRTTSYFSELKPRFYWSKIEALTIEVQQDLVFRNLLIDLNEQ